MHAGADGGAGPRTVVGGLPSPLLPCLLPLSLYQGQTMLLQVPPDLRLSSLPLHRATQHPISTDLDEAHSTRVPLRTHIPKAAQEAFARCLLAALSGGHLEQRHAGMDGPFSSGNQTLLQQHPKTECEQWLQGAREPFWQKPRTLSKRKRGREDTPPDPLDEEDDFQNSKGV